MNEDKASRYHRLKRRAAIVSVGANAGVLVLLLASGASGRLRDLALRTTGGANDVATVAVYVCLLASIQGFVLLPIVFYDGFLIEQRYGLSSEPAVHFMRDHVKAGLVTIIFALVASEIVYGAMRLWPRAWWIASSLVLVCGIVLLAAIAPIVLMPMFYRFKPLERRDLQERLGALSRRAGIRVLGVYEWGLGARTRRASAALVGTGRTRRMLLSDTLLDVYSDDEIEVILAHELGHHAHGDIVKAVVVEAVLTVGCAALSAVALEALWRPLRLAGPSDVGGLPVLVLASGTLVLVVTPILNVISRHHERRADSYALALTGQPAAFVSAMRRLAAQNLAETNPSSLALWLFHAHPPVAERIAGAQAFAERAASESRSRPPAA